MRRALIVTLLAALALPALAPAANRPHELLDRLATEVAGKPLTVHCEASMVDWTGPLQGADYAGFTYPAGAPIIYIAPTPCMTLHALLQRESVGSYNAAGALLTLAHEAVHQRGILDEGETSCLALPLVPSLAVSFGVPATVSEAYTVKRSRLVTLTRWVKVGGRRVKLSRRVKVTSTRIAQRQVANPWLARLTTDALRWHRALPPNYQGGC